MPNTKRINKEEGFQISSGDLTIRSIPGDAHITASRIYKNDVLIAYGEGLVQATCAPGVGDKFEIIATINKPAGTSDHASITVELEDEDNSSDWTYTSYQNEYDEVIYTVIITLT